MCTLVIARRPGDVWPVLIAANRDEMTDRPWQPPARHWPDRADIVAGRDALADGSWLGINDSGVAAAILNRTGSLGTADDKRSRGELVLEALDHADARDAVVALAALDGRAYRSFNLIVADNRDAYWLRSAGDAEVIAKAISPGVHMITSRELDDAESPRIRNFLERFRGAAAPDVAAATNAAR
ncbi:MAG: NRDE family protein [Alphaproteobacteria bacterium]